MCNCKFNKIHKIAVEAFERPVVFFAGAGSGKTRVLVHRVAWLIAIYKVPLQNIFVVTFTNKAATEMRKRIEDILNYPTKSFWIGTFHGLAHKFLRIHWEEAGLDKNFQIMDSLDQIRMIKKMLKALNKSESDFSPKDIQLFINKNKDAGLRPDKLLDGRIEEDSEIIELYRYYDDLCKSSSLVDFSELILRVIETLKKNQDLLEEYQKKFNHLLIDEFQDTNTIQYDLLKLLAGNNNSIFAVGDDLSLIHI